MKFEKNILKMSEEAYEAFIFLWMFFMNYW